MSRRVAIALTFAFLSACGGEPPTTPTPGQPTANLQLPPGSYWLSLTGFAFSDDPSIPPCENPFLLGGRTGALLSVEVSAGNQLVARSTSGAGDIELQLSETGTTFGAFSVNGRLSGGGTDLLESLPATSRGRVQANAVLTGLAERYVVFLRGTASGDIRFTNNDGTAVSRCTVITWTLQPKAQ